MSFAKASLGLGLALALGWLLPWRLLGATPDFVVIAVIAIATARPGADSLVLAALGGLALDVASASRFGSHALLLVAIGQVAGKLGARVDVGAWPVRVALVAAGALVAQVGSSVLLRALERLPLELSVSGTFASVLASALASLVLWRGPLPSVSEAS